MTLTELLVVIMILVVLLGAALPIMRTAVEDRGLREAARQVNTYVQLAKSRAAETGRPVGLWLDTEDLSEGYDVTPSPPANTTVSPFARRLFLAETPPPYAGDTVGAQVKIYVNPDPTDPPFPYYARSAVSLSGSLSSLVKPADRIKFDFQGPAYPVGLVRLTPQPPASPVYVDVYFSLEANQLAPRIFDANDPNLGLVKYQVFRGPQKSSSTPLELSGGAVIDLTNSGAGLTGREFANANTPVVIQFSPSGAVDRVMGGGASLVPTATIHLLIGSLSNLMEEGSNTATYGAYNRNLENTANLWVSIGHQSGHVVTQDNAWEARADFDSSLSAAREFAQSAHAKGGR